jgi:hypothetical protein
MHDLMEACTNFMLIYASVRGKGISSRPKPLRGVHLFSFYGKKEEHSFKRARSQQLPLPQLPWEPTECVVIVTSTKKNYQSVAFYFCAVSLEHISSGFKLRHNQLSSRR